MSIGFLEHSPKLKDFATGMAQNAQVAHNQDSLPKSSEASVPNVPSWSSHGPR